MVITITEHWLIAAHVQETYQAVDIFLPSCWSVDMP